MPNIKSDEALTVDQAFRSLVTGGGITIRAMRRDPFNADIYPRILFTSNDHDIIRSIVGHRDLTDDDTRAIELRLLSIEVGDAAQRMLTAKGNFAHTRGWVRGPEGSNMTLANHIAYLFEHRRPSRNGTNRLLVEGQVNTELVHSMRLRSSSAQVVLRTLVNLLTVQTARNGVHVHDNRMYVTAAGVVEYIESGMTNPDPITLPQAGRVLRQFAKRVEGDGGTRVKKSVPPGLESDARARWIEVDLGILFEEGVLYGLNVKRVEALLSKQEDGPALIERVLAGIPKELE